MNKDLLEVRINSWNDLLDLANIFNGSIFRGHKRTNYLLSPKIERVANESNIHSTDLRQLESKMIFEFARRAHNYSEFKLSDNINILELLSIIQHHGGPTRLIDFSYSIYVACYFAISETDNDAAVWVVDKNKLLSDSHRIVYSEKYIPNKYDLYSDNDEAIWDHVLEVQGSMNSDMMDIFNKSFLDYDHQHKVVIPVEPTNMTQRLSLQKGLFITQCSTKYTFHECMKNTLGIDLDKESRKSPLNFSFSENKGEADMDLLNSAYNESGIFKIIIPKELHSIIRNDLWEMGLNEETLFPGLDGLARSLSFYLKPVKNEEKYSDYIVRRLSDSLKKWKRD